jgi:antitoxin (DNA-binding transcriptional repressor) of toxin-antitoxin stability system
VIRVDVLQAQADLPLYLERVAHGERVLLCKDNEPIAEIRPLAEAEPADEPRPLGLAKGLVEVPSTFFDPLPEELLRLFSGESSEKSAQ